MSGVHSSLNQSLADESVVRLRAERASGAAQSATRAAVDVSVVIACYNEEDGIERLYQNLMNMLEEAEDHLRWEFVLVDDGSIDGTVQKIRNTALGDSRFQLVRLPENRGLIGALQAGFAAAQGRWVACLDADCTYSPSLVNVLVDEAERGYDVVTASPYHVEGRVVNVPAWRIGLSKIASRLYRVVMRSRISCFTCCVRVYRREMLVGCSMRYSGFVGVTELLWRLEQRGAKISEVPAELRPRVTGASKMRTLRTTGAHFRLLFRILAERMGIVRGQA